MFWAGFTFPGNLCIFQAGRFHPVEPPALDLGSHPQKGRPLFIPSSFFFNYMDYSICMCDSCLYDYAELTLTEHSCTKINSGCICLDFQMSVLQTPSWGTPKLITQMAEPGFQAVTLLWSTPAHPLLPSFFAVPMWIRVGTWENLLFTHCSLHCQSYKWLLSALGWAGNQFNMCFAIIPLLSLLFGFSKNYKHVVLKFYKSFRADDSLLLLPQTCASIFFPSVAYFLNFI